mmetsp:Transcript_17973/g.61261  ORF Transcript_17973/g.61261 Transcript_17973/m.61261 type:complete len:254 (-) Transcript_17973:277-1038(-)|eukprot:CAMPEP_0183797828 /NCGR_PEP_ID=MMETSP0803_2-20130417/17210_1 /TAXON_ID=195967 /ORGANISM="Crustomastix stigmata, Strain CCMP3273" /LENGTH=253 /DNA_ID=CAMNT_0026042501 /DNA_START=177 /DNA_END=938 /DNA_ORIENTATION=+
MSSSDHGKVALVTGGATGIGAEVVKKLACTGMRVVINYYPEDLYAQANELAQSIGGDKNVFVVFGDVSKEQDCLRVVQHVVSLFGKLDKLVLCAGITKVVPHCDFDGLSYDDFMKMYAVNTVGNFFMIKSSTPFFTEEGGSVVVISSMAGVYGNGSSIAYCCSKAAVNNLVITLARVLLPKNIRINAVCPGVVDTKFWEKSTSGPGIAAHTLLQNFKESSVISPAEIASAVYHTLSLPKTTGQLVIVDNGHTL